MGKFRLLNHTADVKIRAEGKTLKEALEVLVDGFFHYQFRQVNKAREELTGLRQPVISRQLQIKFNKLNLLPVDLLNEIIYYQNFYKELYPQLKIKELTEKVLKGELRGKKIFQFAIRDIKAATYNELLCQQSKTGWLIEVVLDI